MVVERLVEGDLAGGVLAGGLDLVCLSVVNLIGCHQTEAGVVMCLIVPSEKMPDRTAWRLRCSRSTVENWVGISGF